MARTSNRAGIGTSARGQAGAPVSPSHETGDSWAVQGSDGATLATDLAGAFTGQPGAAAGASPPGGLGAGAPGLGAGAAGSSAGLGAGAAIRAARLRDASRALDRGDVRGAVGLVLSALEAG